MSSSEQYKRLYQRGVKIGEDVGELDSNRGIVIVFECPDCGRQRERYRQVIYKPLYCDDCDQPDPMETRRTRKDGNVLQEYNLVSEILDKGGDKDG